MGTATHSIDAVLRGQAVTHSIDAKIFLTLSGPNEMTLYYTNKDPQNVSDVAQYVTSFEDLDNNNWKHIKHVDAIGDYGNNDIKLSWSVTPNYSRWSAYQTRTPATLPDQATRWHNLGQARRMAYKIRWVGSSQINHEALEVSYNIRTQ